MTDFSGWTTPDLVERGAELEEWKETAMVADVMAIARKLSQLGEIRAELGTREEAWRTRDA